ncbi:mersacidin/lichenicidin family type 2 lantibiotic [Cystobacter fuscus]|uniref:mersacidin/lichenicidin family type 2 lantibiotic n=1 Tax=Cystobacter fuscus TaxID=43 RepID=UPI0009715386|nr:mersacidin/lichenicidin family type 2 lantibiotic [Cystobacter fuscus]
MSKKVIQVWKDEDFRLSMTEEERARFPDNPAGLLELTDEALDALVHGAAGVNASCGWSSCNRTN